MEYRENFKEWIEKIWAEKDKEIEKIKVLIYSYLQPSH
jgi:hypothetical protein